MTAAVLATFGASAPAWAGHNVITPDGRTRTRLDVHGDTTDIHTRTVSGNDAFNSFHRFEEARGKTVNMHLPHGADNLINLVHDRKTLINGTLNSLKNGKIGGHVYFADPHGLVVGAAGVLNVGALTVTTPTKQFMDGVIGPNGQIHAGAVAALKAGAAPQAAHATVDIKGKVNARHGAAIQARTVDASGVIMIQQPRGEGKLSAGAAVNVGDSGGDVQLAQSDGGIRIVAGDAHISGTLAADGVNGAGGQITVAADHDIDANGATLHANGSGAHANGGMVDLHAGHDAALVDTTITANSGQSGDGGRVRLLADHDIQVDQLQLAARAGATGGDGGFMEISAQGSATLGAVDYDAGAPVGRAGSFVIDPSALNITKDIDSDKTSGGTNLAFAASQSITVDDNVTINTRQVASGKNPASDDSTGDSGNITLTAPMITLGQGAKLLTWANNGKNAGDITLSSEVVYTDPTDNSSTYTYIPSVADLTFGENSRIDAHATGAGAAGTVDIDVQTRGRPTDLPIWFPDGILSAFSDTNPTPKSTIAFADGAKVNGGTVTVTAHAVDNDDAPSDVNALLGKANAKATLTVAGADITGEDKLELIAHAEAVNVASSEIADAGAKLAKPILKTLGVTLDFGYASATAHSTIEVKNGSTLKSPALSLDAHSEETAAIDSTAIGAKKKKKRGPKKNTTRLALGIAYGELDGDASVNVANGATLDGESGGEVTVKAGNDYGLTVQASSLSSQNKGKGANGASISAAGAIGVSNLSASATVNGLVKNADSVEITAENTGAEAPADAGSPPVPCVDTAGLSVCSTSSIAAKKKKKGDTGGTGTGNGGGGTGGTGSGSEIGFSGNVAYNYADIAATAKLGQSGEVDSGDLAIEAKNETEITTSAGAAITGPAKKKKKSGGASSHVVTQPLAINALASKGSGGGSSIKLTGVLALGYVNAIDADATLAGTVKTPKSVAVTAENATGIDTTANASNQSGSASSSGTGSGGSGGGGGEDGKSGSAFGLSGTLALLHMESGKSDDGKKLGINATAQIAADAKLIDFDDTPDITVWANNHNTQFATEALGLMPGKKKGGKSNEGAQKNSISIGFLAAVAQIHTAASAAVNADVGSNSQKAGNVLVEADSTTDETKTEGKSILGSPKKAKGGFIKQFLGQQKNLQKGESGGGSGGSTRIGSAIAFTDSHNNATATVGAGDSQPVITSDGNVTVTAKTSSDDIHNIAESVVKTKPGDNTKNGVSIGAAIGLYHPHATALVGHGSTIDAKHVGVASAVGFKPAEFSLERIVDLVLNKGAKAALNTAPAEFMTSYANAAADASNLALSGAVSYLETDSQSKAQVGDSVKLTVSGGDDWSIKRKRKVAENEGDTPTRETQSFDKAITVHADNVVDTRADAGNLEIFKTLLGLTKGKFKESVGAEEGSAVGGAFNEINYDNETTAVVGSNAELTATSGGVSVATATTDHTLMISPTAGAGKSFAGNAIFALANLDSKSRAAISNRATIDSDGLDLGADEDLNAITLAGAVSKSKNAGVGIGIAVNDISTDTEAFIGPLSVFGIQGLGSDEDNDDNAGVTAGDVTIAARTHGEMLALAVAGAAAVADKDKTGKSEQSGRSGNDQYLTGNNDTVNGAQSSAGDRQQTSTQSGSESQKPAQKIRDKQKAGAASGKSKKAKFGLAISGSGAANNADLTTKAYIDAATVHGNDGVLTITAANGVDQSALAGAAALQVGSGGGKKFKATVAGAIGLNLVTNDTEAYAADATLKQLNSVDIGALRGGDELGVGLAVAADTGSGKKSATIAGSVSVSKVVDTTKAHATDTTITGAGNAAQASLTAYNATSIGNGAGSLYVAPKGTVGVGLALSYADIKNDTEALIEGGSVSGLDTLDAAAYDPSHIASAAASVGVSGAKVALTGAFVFNLIRNTTSAVITGDDDGNAATVTTDGDVTLTATGSPNDGTKQTLDDRLAGTDPDDVLIGAGDDYLFTGGDKLTFDSGGSDDSKIKDGTRLADGPGASIIGLAGALSVGKNKANIGLSLAFNDIANTTSTDIENASVNTDGDVALHTDDQSRIVGLAIGVGASSGQFTGVGSVTVNLIKNKTLATIGDPKADDTLTDVQISGNRNAKAGGVSATATNDGQIYDLAGGVAIAAKGVGAAVALSYDDIHNTTHAGLANATLDIADKADFEADNTAGIHALAVGLGVGKNAAISGSLVLNDIGSNTLAKVDHSNVTAAKLAINADDQGTIETLAGSLAGSTKVAVGAAFALNNIGNLGAVNPDASTRATLTDSALTVSDTTDVEASDTSTINSAAVAAAGSGKAAVTGSLTANNIYGDTTAGISNTSLDSTSNDTTVKAIQKSQIKSLAGSASFSGKAGIGAAIAVNRIGTDVEAHIHGDGSDASPLYHAKNVTISASSTNPNNDNSANIQTLAAGVGGGGSVGGAASVAVNIETGAVSAEINDGAKVTAEDNIGVLAHNRQGVDVLAGSLGIGASRAGLGFGLVVNDLLATTSATIEGTNTQVNALAKDSGDMLDVASGQLADPDDVDVDSIQSFDDYAAPNLSEKTTSVTGLAVSAASQQSVATLGASAALSFNPEGSAALSAMVGVNVLGGTTEAYIQNARVNQGSDQTNAGNDQQVSIIGSSHTYAANFVAGIAGGAGDFAGAGAVDVNTFKQKTRAFAAGAKITSKGETHIDAEASQRAVGIAAGLAAAITGGAGTGIINLFNADTEAFVGSDQVENDNPPPDRIWRASTVHAGKLSVTANSENDANLVGGSGAFGGAGLAGTFLLGVSKNTTNAYVGDGHEDTTLHVPGAVAVKAISATGLHSTTLTASGGGFAVAGMAAVTKVGNHTNASLEHVHLNQDASEAGASAVTVKAHESMDLSPKAGAVAGGGSAAGLAANVIVLDSQVGAAIGNSKVNAKGGDVTVTAESDKSIDAATIAGAVSDGVSISGAAGVIVFGQGSLATDDPNSDNDGKLDASDALDKNNTLSSLGGFGHSSPVNSDETGDTLSSDELKGVNAASQVSLVDENGNLNQGRDGTTAALTHSTVTTSSLTVKAKDTNSVSNIIGGLAAGSTLGAGGAVGFTLVRDAVGATVDGNSTIKATGDVGIDAEVDNGSIDNALNGLDSSKNDEGIAGLPVINDNNNYAVQTIAVQGAAGTVGLGAAVAISEIDNNVQANVAGSINPDAGNTANGDTLTIGAHDNSAVAAIGGGASLGGLAAGVVVAKAEKSSRVLTAAGKVTGDGSIADAEINGSETKLKGFKHIKLDASDSGAVKSLAAGVSAGLGFAANGSVAISDDTADIGAIVGHNATLAAGDGGTDVYATDNPKVSAGAYGVSVAGTAALGASVATASDSATVAAAVRDHASVVGAASLSDTGAGDSDYYGNSAALNLEARNLHDGGVDSVHAKAVGGAGGSLLGAQASVANAKSDADVDAHTGLHVQLPDGDVVILARNKTSQNAIATGVGIGFVGVGAAVTHATAYTATNAAIGTGNSTNDDRDGDLIIHAVGTDTDRADSTAGSGGVVSGSAATANTQAGKDDNAADVTTRLGKSTLHAGTIDAAATHTVEYAATTNAVGAGIASASGAKSKNTADSTVTTTIADGSNLYASGNIQLGAENRFTNVTGATEAARGGAGGGIAGAGAGTSTTINGRTQTRVGDGADLVSGLDPAVADALANNPQGYIYTSGHDPFATPGSILINAGSYVTVDDSTTEMNVGGVAGGAGVNSTFSATLHDNVDIGDRDKLVTNGSLGIGTFDRVDVTRKALVHSYGGGAVGDAKASVDIDANQAVNIGRNDTLLAFKNIRLTAGNDAAGFRSSQFQVKSIAQAFVRGVIAIAHANASATVDSSANLAVAAGTNVESGADATLGTYATEPDASAKGTGHGYELGFIPVTQHGSDVNVSHHGTVTLEGDVAAGIYHDNEIKVGSCAAAGCAKTDLQHTSGAPLYYQYLADFNPHDYIDAHADGLKSNTDHSGNTGIPTSAGLKTPKDSDVLSKNGSKEGSSGGSSTGDGDSGDNPNAKDANDLTVTGVLKSTTTGKATDAYQLGSLYAAGGDARIHADTIKGSGNVVAHGGPKVDVENDSRAYLVLGAANIPNRSGGKVRFTGAADSKHATGLSVTADSGADLPTIDIRNTYSGKVKGPGEKITQGPAIFLGGRILNLGGLVKISNQSGSVGQFAPISAQQIKEYVPNGAVAVYLPDGTYHSGSDPAALWADQQIVLGDADSAIGYVISAIYDEDDSKSKSSDINHYFYYRGKSHVLWKKGNPSNSARVFYGQCAPHAIGGDCGTKRAKKLSPVDGAYGFYQTAFPKLPSKTLTKVIKSYPDDLAETASKSALAAKIIVVNAKTIDIDSKVTAGSPTDVKVKLSDTSLADAFDDLSTDEKQIGQLAAGGRTVYYAINLPGVDGADAPVSYTDGHLKVQDINASGGGVISLKGDIINTTTLGELKVNDGYGHVDIDNATDLPLRVGNINTGNSALGEITIDDTAKDRKTWYRDRPGTGLAIRDDRNGAVTFDTAHHVCDVTEQCTQPGKPLIYQPKTGRRYEWTQQVNLRRDIHKVGDGATWQFVDGDGDKSTGPTYILTGSRIVDGKTDGPAFRESISGNAGANYIEHIYYHGCDDGKCNYGFPKTTDTDLDDKKKAAGVYEYVYATKAQLTLTESTRADNPIGINFNGNASGLVTIDSNSSVQFGGRISNPTGKTTVTAAPEFSSIDGGTEASVASKSIALNAGTGIGSENRPIEATLIGDTGRFSASAGSAGVFVHFGSDARLDRVTAPGNTLNFFGTPYLLGDGDIVLTADGSITGKPGQTSVSGGNITLRSAQGEIGVPAAGGGLDPLVVHAQGYRYFDGSIGSGVVNATAVDDINLQQVGEDLRIGQIKSTGNGDVSLAAPDGAIIDAAGTTSGQALSDQQLDTIQKQLHLTGDDARDTARDKAATSLKHQVEAKYQQYWSLTNNGYIDGSGRFELDSDKLALYQPLARAELGGDVTAAEVQDYANTRYQDLKTFLGGKGIDLTSKQSGFAFTPTDGQIKALTDGAAFAESKKQLVQAINFNGLQAGEPPTIGTATPNVVGRNITLSAHDGIGALGKSASIKFVDLQAGNLSDEQAAALAAAAAPGDVVLKDGDKTVTLAELKAYKDPQDHLSRIEASQTEPLFLTTTGTVDAQTAGGSDGSIFLQDNGDLKLGRIDADRDARLIAVNNLIDGRAARTGPVITAGRDLTLLAGSSGNIGVPAAPDASPAVAADPLTYQAGGKLKAARAGGDVVLQAVGQDMVLGRVGAGGDVDLEAPAGGIYGYLDGLSINGSNIDLNAGDGIGFYNDVSKYLDLQVADDGLLNGLASGAIRIASPQAGKSLTIDTLTADDSLDVVSQGALSADMLTAKAGYVNAAADGDADFGTVTASGGSATLTATADLSLETVTSDKTNGTAVDVQAGGTITGKPVADGDANVYAQAADAGINLAAGTGIGDPLIVATRNLAAVSDTGDVDIIDLLGLDSASIDAKTGSIDATAHGDFHFSTVHAGENATLVADRDMTGSNLATEHGDIHADAGRDLSIDTIVAGRSAYLTAGRRMTFGRIDIAKDLGLTAGSDIDFDTITVGDGIAAESTGGSITGNHLLARHGDLAARKNIRLGAADIERRLNLRATDISATVTQTAQPPSAPFNMIVTGYPNGRAQRIRLSIDAPIGLIFNRLAAERARIDTSADRVNVQKGNISRRMRLNTPSMRLLLDNITPLLADVDVQLMQPRYRFYLRANGRKMATNAFVTHYLDGYQANQVSNFTASHRDGSTLYGGESAVRYTFRTLNRGLDSPGGGAGGMADGYQIFRMQTSGKAGTGTALLNPPVTGVAVNVGLSAKAN